MNLGNIWKKLKGQHVLTDIDRERAAETNKARFELQRLKIEKEKDLLRLESEKRELQLRRDLARLNADIDDIEGNDDDSGNDFNTLAGLLSGVLARQQTPAVVASVSQPVTTPQALHLTDEQINDIWEKIPLSARKAAKMLSDEQIRLIIEQKVGSVDSDTLARALNRIKA